MGTGRSRPHAVGADGAGEGHLLEVNRAGDETDFVLYTAFTFFPSSDDLWLQRTSLQVGRGRRRYHGTYLCLHLNRVEPRLPPIAFPHITLAYCVQYTSYETMHRHMLTSRALLTGNAAGVDASFVAYPRSRTSVRVHQGCELFALCRLLQQDLPPEAAPSYRNSWELHLTLV
jgi:hypothetical protein